MNFSAHFRKTVIIAWQAILCPHWHRVKQELLNSQATFSRRTTLTHRSIIVHAKEATHLKQLDNSQVQIQSRQSLSSNE
jgi:hypothetical protein